MGFSAVDIAERVGHESAKITYRYTHMFPTKDVDIINATINMYKNDHIKMYKINLLMSI